MGGVLIIRKHVSIIDGLAERSKALDLGSSPKGRGFKSHSRQFSFGFMRVEMEQWS